MERVTRVEAALVEGFFPGEGQISTGRPRWDGGPRDRVRLRRCLYGAALLVAGVCGIGGSLLLDVLVSWVASGFAADGDLSGVFLLGWIVSIAWFVRRGVWFRRWYRSGMGREVELASQAVPVPAAEGAVTLPPAIRRARTVVAGCASVFFLGVGVWCVVDELDARARTRPFADGVVTTGTVVEVHASDDGTAFQAESRFTDGDGQPHTVTGLLGGDRAHVGDEVEVSYRPSDPTEAHDLTTNADAWKLPLGVFVYMTLAGLVGSTLVLVRVLKRSRWPASSRAA